MPFSPATSSVASALTIAMATTIIALLRPDAPDADGVAALVAQFLLGEAHAHAFLGDEHDLVDAVGELASMRRSPSSIWMAMMPPLRMFLKSERFDFFTIPLRVAKTMCRLRRPGLPRRSSFPCMRMVAAIFSPGFEFQEIRDRAALGRAAHLGNLVHLLDVDSAFLREEHQVIVRRSGEEMLDEIVLVLARSSRLAGLSCRSRPCRRAAARGRR